MTTACTGGSSFALTTPRQLLRYCRWGVNSLVLLSCVPAQPPTPPAAPVEERVELSIQVNANGCTHEAQQAVIKLTERADYYSFALDQNGYVAGSVLGVKPGNYSADAFALTADGRQICQTPISFKVAPGMRRQALTLSCESSCEPQPTTVAKGAVQCPIPTISHPSYGFQNVETSLSGSVSPQAPVQYRWSSETLTLSGTSQAVAAAQCQGSGMHRLRLDVDSTQCGGSATAELKCIDSDASVVSPASMAKVSWGGSAPGAELPVTGAVFESSEKCPKERQGAEGSWKCQELSMEMTRTSRGPAVKHRCACQWFGSSPRAPADLQLMDKLSAPETWTPDGPAIGPSQAGVSAAAVSGDRDKLSDRGKTYLGTNSELLEAPASVRVAVIDTTRRDLFDKGPVTDNVLHGRAVATLIADTACGKPNANCPVKVRNYLALKVLGATSGKESLIGVDERDGGNAGTLLDLSHAIDRAVDDWAKSDKPEDHLIINLSVGWDPIWGGVAKEDPKVTPPQLVLESLMRASCHGALIFAAAGNRPPATGGGAPAAPPIYPAAWTNLRAPSAAACPADSPVGSRKVLTGGALLYAVGALDYVDQSLLLSRKTPSLASLGYAAIRRDPAANVEHTMLMTGTSASTAVVSGIAARLWAGDAAIANIGAHKLLAHEIARLLYSKIASRPTKVSADFCPAGTPCKDTLVRTVTLCKGTADCLQPPPQLTTADDEPEPEDTQPAEDVSVEAGVLTPWVVPQPDGDPNCRVCKYLDGKNIVDVDMRDGFGSLNVASMKVYLNNKPGSYWSIPKSMFKKHSGFRARLLGAGNTTGHGTIKYVYSVGVGTFTVEETLVIAQ